MTDQMKVNTKVEASNDNFKTYVEGWLQRAEYTRSGGDCHLCYDVKRVDSFEVKTYKHIRPARPPEVRDLESVEYLLEIARKEIRKSIEGYENNEYTIFSHIVAALRVVENIKEKMENQ